MILIISLSFFETIGSIFVNTSFPVSGSILLTTPSIGLPVFLSIKIVLPVSVSFLTIIFSTVFPVSLSIITDFPVFGSFLTS